MSSTDIPLPRRAASETDAGGDPQSIMTRLRTLSFSRSPSKTGNETEDKKPELKGPQLSRRNSGSQRFVRTSSLAGPEKKPTGNKPHHMRWRDKIKYLEEQRRHSVDSPSFVNKAAKAEPLKDTPDDIPGKDCVVQSFNTEVIKNDEPGNLHTRPAPRPSSTRHKSYSHTFVRHPPHMRFRDKMAILSGKKAANFAGKSPAAVVSEE